ncbi:hypothetical protein LNTAR_24878 [Lentisphaera araneosa HTCC2155]|jgi:hypothetical protein|uniref:Uncharacterized protein n=1 Tax=Lentisphaera araneosa HTCC2155 TaxID=313628 RepID=A6DSY3_9BACT|nr:hypothetical protein [Lentisphaera araneosa]EDM25273.1 hypothetical protein LNTAR_24878 [Lentisphaera araneosa HTCC2155]
MATIVRSKQTDKTYILLGTGFGSYQSAKPHWFFGNSIPETDEGQNTMICVCDNDGNIGWLDSAEAIVISVDGQKLNEINPKL